MPISGRILTLGSSLALAAVPAFAAETAKVDGADVTYPVTVEQDGATLRLTGTGLRKKLFFNVYTIASYVDAEAKLSDAKALSSFEGPKRLHIVMERDVDGETMADAFRDAIAKNYDLKALATEVKQLEGYLRGEKAKEDSEIVFEHVRGQGVRIRRSGKAPITIGGLPFSRAVWDIYLGKENVSGDIKKGLISKL